MERNRIWQDELVFYESTAKQSPKAASILNNLGATYNRRHRPLEAIGAFEASIAVHPSPHALKNLGYTYAAVGRLQSPKRVTEEPSRWIPQMPVPTPVWGTSS